MADIKKTVDLPLIEINENTSSLPCVDSEKSITLYHASAEVIRNPRWDYQKEGLLRVNKDFGDGFYTSPDREYPIKSNSLAVN